MIKRFRIIEIQIQFRVNDQWVAPGRRRGAVHKLFELAAFDTVNAPEPEKREQDQRGGKGGDYFRWGHGFSGLG